MVLDFKVKMIGCRDDNQFFYIMAPMKMRA